MIKINTHQGDLLGVNHGIIVHGCNCNGVMGSGVAAQIRDKWPDVYRAYRNKVYRNNGGVLGTICAVAGNGIEHLNMRHVNYSTLASHFLLDTSDTLPPTVIVVNAFTQLTFGSEDKVYVNYDAVESCFVQIRMLAVALDMPVHFPLIGCGLAHGDWDIVSHRIQKGAGDEVDLNLWLYDPST